VIRSRQRFHGKGGGTGGSRRRGPRQRRAKPPGAGAKKPTGLAPHGGICHAKAEGVSFELRLDRLSGRDRRRAAHRSGGVFLRPASRGATDGGAGAVMGRFRPVGPRRGRPVAAVEPLLARPRRSPKPDPDGRERLLGPVAPSDGSPGGNARGRIRVGAGPAYGVTASRRSPRSAGRRTVKRPGRQ